MNYWVIPGLKSAFKHESGPKMNDTIIISTVCEYFKVTLNQLKSVRRDRQIVFPRQLAMYYLYYYCNKSTVEIGRIFKKDHTTVVHSLRKVRGWMQVDQNIYDQVLELRSLIIDNHS